MEDDDKEFIRKLIQDKIDNMSCPTVKDYNFIIDAIETAKRLYLGQLFIEALRTNVKHIIGFRVDDWRE